TAQPRPSRGASRAVTGGRISSEGLCFFFFSSRRRHTRFSRDWSSDVCSSDLGGRQYLVSNGQLQDYRAIVADLDWVPGKPVTLRSEERRVGKGSREGWTVSYSPETNVRKRDRITSPQHYIRSGTVRPALKFFT